MAISRSAGDAVSVSVKAKAGAREEGPRGQNFSVCQPGTGGQRGERGGIVAMLTGRKSAGRK